MENDVVATDGSIQKVICITCRCNISLEGATRQMADLHGLKTTEEQYSMHRQAEVCVQMTVVNSDRKVLCDMLEAQ